MKKIYILLTRTRSILSRIIHKQGSEDWFYLRAPELRKELCFLGSSAQYRQIRRVVGS